MKRSAVKGHKECKRYDRACAVLGCAFRFMPLLHDRAAAAQAAKSSGKSRRANADICRRDHGRPVRGERIAQRGHGESEGEYAANCVKGCARRYGYVLYVPSTRKIYKLSDQERPAELAAKRVKIKGALNKATQTIYVSSIEPVI